MDHSSDELVEIFLSKNHAKEPKELAKFLHLTFSNPNVPPPHPDPHQQDGNPLQAATEERERPRRRIHPQNILKHPTARADLTAILHLRPLLII